MDGKNLGDGFHFNYDEFSHDKVEAVPAVQRYALVAEWKGDLPLIGYSPYGQFSAQARFIGRLEKAWTELLVHL